MPTARYFTSHSEPSVHPKSSPGKGRAGLRELRGDPRGLNAPLDAAQLVSAHAAGSHPDIRLSVPLRLILLGIMRRDEPL